MRPLQHQPIRGRAGATRTGAFAPAAQEHARSCRAGRVNQVAAKAHCGSLARWVPWCTYRLLLAEEKRKGEFRRVMASASFPFQTLSGRTVCHKDLDSVVAASSPPGHQLQQTRNNSGPRAARGTYHSAAPSHSLLSHTNTAQSPRIPYLLPITDTRGSHRTATQDLPILPSATPSPAREGDQRRRSPMSPDRPVQPRPLIQHTSVPQKPLDWTAVVKCALSITAVHAQPAEKITWSMSSSARTFTPRW